MLADNHCISVTVPLYTYSRPKFSDKVKYPNKTKSVKGTATTMKIQDLLPHGRNSSLMLKILVTRLKAVNAKTTYVKHLTLRASIND